MTSSEADRRGGVSKSPCIETETYVNKRTGERMQVPKGISPGWHTNSGKLRAQNLRAMLDEKLASTPKTLRAAAIADMAGSNFLRHMHAGRITAPKAIAGHGAEVKKRLCHIP